VARLEIADSQSRQSGLEAVSRSADSQSRQSEVEARAERDASEREASSASEREGLGLGLGLGQLQQEAAARREGAMEEGLQLARAEGRREVYVMLCYVMVPLLPPVNCVEDSWGLQDARAEGRREVYYYCRGESVAPATTSSSTTSPLPPLLLPC
jgi:hypothetical protein